MKSWVIMLGFVVLLAASMSFVRGSIIINEVMYDPGQCEDAYCEYIEIYNNGTTETNLTLWKFCDDEILAGYINYTNGSLVNNISLILPQNSYGLITDGGSGTSVYNIFNVSETPMAFHVDASSICGSLSNSGELITLYDDNDVIITSLSYNTSVGANGNNKSLQLCNGSWKEATPTPGLANNCTQTCTPSTACSNSTCTNSRLTQTCNITYSNCTTAAAYQNFSCNSSSEDEDDEDGIYLELEWNEDDIVNGDEFDITVNAYNLESGEDYDVKVYIIYEEDEITQIYDEVDEEWEGWNEYASEVVSGPGDESGEVTLRIKDDYDDAYGDAEIKASIRESPDGSAIDTFEDDIEVLEPDEDDNDDSSGSGSSSSSSTKTTSKKTNSSASITGSAISLGGDDEDDGNKTSAGKNSTIYKSAAGYIKEYAIYGFSIVCVGIIIFLLRNKL